MVRKLMSSKNYELRLLQWDTDYFGVSSARVNLSGIVDDTGQEEIIEFCKGYDFVTISNLDNIKDLALLSIDDISNIINRNLKTTLWKQKEIKKYKKNVMPAYVIFISDGGIRESAQIKKIITEAAAYPIFWQFVGLGGKNYGILEKLDTLENKIVYNANFFSLDANDKITDEELYNKLLNEFPLWIKEAKTKAII